MDFGPQTRHSQPARFCTYPPHAACAPLRTFARVLARGEPRGDHWTAAPGPEHRELPGLAAPVYRPGVDPVLAAATVGTVTSGNSVPEPASGVLLLGGLGALLAKFRRRQLTT
jgi:PEP-CTERM motif